jgi:hypothetical protein
MGKKSAKPPRGPAQSGDPIHAALTGGADKTQTEVVEEALDVVSVPPKRSEPSQTTTDEMKTPAVQEGNDPPQPLMPASHAPTSSTDVGGDISLLQTSPFHGISTAPTRVDVESESEEEDAVDPEADDKKADDYHQFDFINSENNPSNYLDQNVGSLCRMSDDYALNRIPATEKALNELKPGKQLKEYQDMLQDPDCQTVSNTLDTQRAINIANSVLQIPKLNEKAQGLAWEIICMAAQKLHILPTQLAYQEKHKALIDEAKKRKRRASLEEKLSVAEAKDSNKQKDSLEQSLVSRKKRERSDSHLMPGQRALK